MANSTALFHQAPPHAEWSLASHLDLGILPGSIPCARWHTHHVLRDWRLRHLADDVELVVSELVTNAIQAADSTVRLWLMSDRKQVGIFVQDNSLLLPERREPDDDATEGRGLVIVEAYAACWGAYPILGGKVVWAIVR